MEEIDGVSGGWGGRGDEEAACQERGRAVYMGTHLWQTRGRRVLLLSSVRGRQRLWLRLESVSVSMRVRLSGASGFRLSGLHFCGGGHSKGGGGGGRGERRYHGKHILLFVLLLLSELVCVFVLVCMGMCRVLHSFCRRERKGEGERSSQHTRRHQTGHCSRSPSPLPHHGYSRVLLCLCSSLS
jgi:hypothetical protein